MALANSLELNKKLNFRAMNMKIVVKSRDEIIVRKKFELNNILSFSFELELGCIEEIFLMMELFNPNEKMVENTV